MNNSFFSKGKQEIIEKNGVLAYVIRDNRGEMRAYVVKTQLTGKYHLHAFLKIRDGATIDASFGDRSELENIKRGDPMFKYRATLLDAWDRREGIASGNIKTPIKDLMSGR